MPQEPEMYPCTDYPTYTEKFETFDELRQAVERTSEGLNHIVSWAIGCRECDEVSEDESLKLMWEDGDKNWFTILLFMPRLSKTTAFTVEFPKAVPHNDIDNWLAGYVQKRTLAWYGWSHLDDLQKDYNPHGTSDSV